MVDGSLWQLVKSMNHLAIRTLTTILSIYIKQTEKNKSLVQANIYISKYLSDTQKLAKNNFSLSDMNGIYGSHDNYNY